MPSCNGFRLVVRALILSAYASFFCVSTAVIGQTTIDLDPPKIEHSVPAKVVPGTPLKLYAIITDDGGIEQVTVYYRTNQNGDYQSVSMTNIQGAEYTALLSTAKKQQVVQYYIEMVDVGGNRVLEGSPGSPLVVNAEKKSSNILYLVLGAVAVGLLASSAGGSSGSGDTTDSRVLTINADVPE